jgi:protein involved in ribonucleotide reduction
MQINTMAQNQTGASISADAEKLQLQEMVQDFLNNQENNKRIKSIIGRQNRFNVNMDELR